MRFYGVYANFLRPGTPGRLFQRHIGHDFPTGYKQGGGGSGTPRARGSKGLRRAEARHNAPKLPCVIWIDPFQGGGKMRDAY